MFLDIVIDSGSISSLFIQILKGIIFGILILTVAIALFTSFQRFIEGNKETGYQFLIMSFMLIGSYGLLFCVMYYGFNINLLEVFLS